METAVTLAAAWMARSPALVDDLRGRHGLQKSHAQKQYKDCSQHRDVATAEKAAIDCQKECGCVPGNYPGV